MKQSIYEELNQLIETMNSYGKMEQNSRTNAANKLGKIKAEW